MDVQLKILKRLRQKFEDFRCYLLAFLDYKTQGSSATVGRVVDRAGPFFVNNGQYRL